MKIQILVFFKKIVLINLKTDTDIKITPKFIKHLLNHFQKEYILFKI